MTRNDCEDVSASDLRAGMLLLVEFARGGIDFRTIAFVKSIDFRSSRVSFILWFSTGEIDDDYNLPIQTASQCRFKLLTHA